MVDPQELLVKYLRSVGQVTQLFPSRGGTNSIYAVDLPEPFSIDDGPALLIAARGGQTNIEVPGVIKPRIQFTIWDGIHQNQRARQTYGALFDAVSGSGNATIANVGTVMSLYEVTAAQDLTDPDTDWATVVAFWEMIARK